MITSGVIIFRLIPAKLFRDWMDLFTAGLPLYPEVAVVDVCPTEVELQEDCRRQLLADVDFCEYQVSRHIFLELFCGGNDVRRQRKLTNHKRALSRSLKYTKIL